jgi:hypothetical protein
MDIGIPWIVNVVVEKKRQGENILNFIIILEPKSKLFEWNNTTFPHQGDDLQQKDCYALFSNNSVILVETSTNKSCQCVPSTFVSPDGQYCCTYLKMIRWNIISFLLSRAFCIH